MSRATTIEKFLAIRQARRDWQHPLNLVHAVTGRCNADCEFCAWKYHTGEGDLTTDEIKKLYTDARRAGFIWLTVWGGEPLMRRDIGEIARHAHRLGFASSLVTNGYLLEKKLDEVMPYMQRVCFSVDHASEKHDEIRGMKGLYEKIIGASKKIRKKYPRTTIMYNCTMFRDNISPDSLKGVARLMRSMGAVGIFNPLRDEGASEMPSGLDLKDFVATDGQLAEAYTLLKRLKRRGYPIINSYSYMDMIRKGPPVYNCHWPKFNLPIEANGDVVDCMRWGERPFSNVRDESFSEILRHPRLHELAGSEGEKCHKCISHHRMEMSEMYEGNLEPLFSWAGTVLLSRLLRAV